MDSKENSQLYITGEGQENLPYKGPVIQKQYP